VKVAGRSVVQPKVLALEKSSLPLSFSLSPPASKRRPRRVTCRALRRGRSNRTEIIFRLITPRTRRCCIRHGHAPRFLSPLCASSVSLAPRAVRRRGAVHATDPISLSGVVEPSLLFIASDPSRECPYRRPRRNQRRETGVPRDAPTSADDCADLPARDSRFNQRSERNAPSGLKLARN